MTSADETLIPSELARRWRVDVHRVLAWIKRGDLPAGPPEREARHAD